MPESDDETWAPVPGYEELYEVSDQGRIRSLDRPHQGGKVMTPDDSNPSSPSIRLWRDGHYQRASLSRLVLLAHGPEPETATMRAERIDPEGPSSVKNLRWRRPITQQKLTEQEVVAIYRAAWRAEDDPTTTNDDIGKRYGVSAGAVSHIKNGRSWSHVTDDINRPA